MILIFSFDCQDSVNSVNLFSISENTVTHGTSRRDVKLNIAHIILEVYDFCYVKYDEITRILH